MVLTIEISGHGRELGLNFVKPIGNSEQEILEELQTAAEEIARDPFVAYEHAYGLDEWTITVKDKNGREIGSFSGSSTGSCPELELADGQYAVKFEACEDGTFATGEIALDDKLLEEYLAGKKDGDAAILELVEKATEPHSDYVPGMGRVVDLFGFNNDDVELWVEMNVCDGAYSTGTSSQSVTIISWDGRTYDEDDLA